MEPPGIVVLSASQVICYWRQDRTICSVGIPLRRSWLRLLGCRQSHAWFSASSFIGIGSRENPTHLGDQTSRRGASDELARLRERLEPPEEAGTPGQNPQGYFDNQDRLTPINETLEPAPRCREPARPTPVSDHKADSRSPLPSKHPKILRSGKDQECLRRINRYCQQKEPRVANDCVIFAPRSMRRVARRVAQPPVDMRDLATAEPTSEFRGSGNPRLPFLLSPS